MDRLDRIESVLRQHNQPVVTTAEVAEEIEDVTARTVLDDLRLLQREGTVVGKEAGANTLVWWHEDRVCPPRLPPEDHPDQAGLSDVAAPGAPESAAEVAERNLDEFGEEAGDQRQLDTSQVEQIGEAAEKIEKGEEIREAMDAVDLPGQGSLLEARRNALRQILREIRSAGPMGTPAPYDDAHETHQTGYDSGKSWRKNCAGPALSDLQDAGVLELTDSSRGRWVWAGGDE